MTKTKSQKRRAKQRRASAVKQRRAQPAKKVIRSRSMTGISKTCCDYLKVLNNPFSGACCGVPSPLSQPSRKSVSWVKGTFSTGTANYGSIVVSPRWCAWATANLTDSSIAPIIYTTSTYAETEFPHYSDPGTVSVNTNSSYAFNQLSQSIRARLVACGLRIRNATPMMYRGGVGYMLESQGHDELANNTINFATQQQQSGSVDMNGGWTSIVYHPIDDDENDYYQGQSQASGGSGTNIAPGPFSAHYLGAIISAPASQPQNFEFEVYAVHEYIGALAANSETPTKSDPAGMATVQNISSSINARRPVQGDRSAHTSKLYEAAMNGLSSITAVAIERGAQYVANQFSNRGRPQIAYHNMRTPLNIEEVD